MRWKHQIPWVKSGDKAYRSGDYRKALELWLTVFATREALFGKDHYKIALPAQKVGDLYLNLDNYVEAEKYLKRALSIEEARIAGPHPETARTLIELASFTNERKTSHEPREYLSRGRQMLQKTVGELDDEYAGRPTRSHVVLYSKQTLQKRNRCFKKQLPSMMRITIAVRITQCTQ